MPDARPDPEDLRRLLIWINAWRAAQRTFFAWVEEEYARRRDAHELDRQRARDLLAREAARLPYGRDGRLARTGRGYTQAKARFRQHTDRILEALVIRGEDRFGLKGRRTRMGVYEGGMNPATRRLVESKLREAFAAAQAQVERDFAALLEADDA